MSNEEIPTNRLGGEKALVENVDGLPQIRVGYGLSARDSIRGDRLFFLPVRFRRFLYTLAHVYRYCFYIHITIIAGFEKKWGAIYAVGVFFSFFSHLDHAKRKFAPYIMYG